MGPSHTTSTSKVNVPPPTEAEKRQQALNEGINILNLHEQGYNPVWHADTQSYTFDPIPLTPEQQQEKNMQDKIFQMAYNKLSGIADPETRALVAATFQTQRTAGNEELTRYLREQAGARGLSLSDTPLLRELGLQKSNLETGLRGAEAASLLDVGSAQQNFGLALQNFQEQLRQQAFINRASIGESAQATGLALANQRRAAAGQSVSGSSSNPGQLAGTIMGGIGATASAVSAAYAIPAVAAAL